MKRLDALEGDSQIQTTRAIDPDTLILVFQGVLGVPPRSADQMLLDGATLTRVAEYIWDHWMGEPDEPTQEQVLRAVQAVVDNADSERWRRVALELQEWCRAEIEGLLGGTRHSRVRASILGRYRLLVYGVACEQFESASYRASEWVSIEGGAGVQLPDGTRVWIDQTGEVQCQLLQG